jgi:hypothetical protein
VGVGEDEPTHSPRRRIASVSTIRRPAGCISATASSAVAFVSTSGVFVARSPPLADGIGVDVVEADGEVRDDQQATRPRGRAARRRRGRVGWATIALAPGACSSSQSR